MRLRQNFSWTLAGTTTYAACQWGMLVAIAKLGSPEMVGQFTLGLAISAPVFMFTNLNLRVVQVTDAKRMYRFGDYLALRIIGTTLGMLVVAGIIATSHYQADTAVAIALIAIAKAFEAVSDVCYGSIQQNDRMDRIAKSMIVKGIISLICMAGGVLISRTVVWGTFGLAIAWGVILVTIDLPNASKFQPRAIPLRQWDDDKLIQLAKSPLPPLLARRIVNFKLPYSYWHIKTLARLAWLSLPLGLVMMLISLNLNVPRYFIQNYLGEKDLGIFGALSYLIIFGNLIVNALCESASSRLARYYANAERQKFSGLLIKLMAIGGCFGVLGVLVAAVGGQTLLSLLYRAEYAQHNDLFLWLMVAAGMGYVSSSLGYALTAARYFRVQIPLFTLVTSISALGCLWLVPQYGMKGAAWALIMAALVQMVLNLGLVIRALMQIKSPLPIENNSDL